MNQDNTINFSYNHAEVMAERFNSVSIELQNLFTNFPLIAPEKAAEAKKKSFWKQVKQLVLFSCMAGLGSGLFVKVTTGEFYHSNETQVPVYTWNKPVEKTLKSDQKAAAPFTDVKQKSKPVYHSKHKVKFNPPAVSHMATDSAMLKDSLYNEPSEIQNIQQCIDSLKQDTIKMDTSRFDNNLPSIIHLNETSKNNDTKVNKLIMFSENLTKALSNRFSGAMRFFV